VDKTISQKIRLPKRREKREESGENLKKDFLNNPAVFNLFSIFKEASQSLREIF
jgi:hypothetical protein